jgi:hypothetical protein
MRLPRVISAIASIALLCLSSACSEDDQNSSASEKCAAVKEVVVNCYDSGCANATSSFCNCWNQQMDLNLQRRFRPIEVRLQRGHGRGRQYVYEHDVGLSASRAS